MTAGWLGKMAERRVLQVQVRLVDKLTSRNVTRETWKILQRIYR